MSRGKMSQAPPPPKKHHNSGNKHCILEFYVTAYSTSQSERNKIKYEAAPRE